MPFGMFAHAASRWGSKQGENIATSALCYLLNSYPEAGTQFCSQIADLLPSDLHDALTLRFVEQLVSDSGRVDAAGIGQDGARSLLIECKFDAVLGDSQISGYLGELVRPGVLLFIVPRQRRAQTVQQACAVLGLNRAHFHENGHYSFARIDRATVAVTDWISVLTSLAEVQADAEFAAELAELRAYVDLMTGDEFTALTPEDLSGHIGARWVQFTQLFEEAVVTAQAEGVLELEGSLSGTHGYSGRALRIGPWLTWGGIWAFGWTDTADTPLWLDFTAGPGRPDLEAALRALQPLETSEVGRVFERRDHVVVPLYLKCAAERGEVVEDLVAQLRLVRQLIDEFHSVGE